jgi:hypothetical protein
MSRPLINGSPGGVASSPLLLVPLARFKSDPCVHSCDWAGAVHTWFTLPAGEQQTTGRRWTPAVVSARGPGAASS